MRIPSTDNACTCISPGFKSITRRLNYSSQWTCTVTVRDRFEHFLKETRNALKTMQPGPPPLFIPADESFARKLKTINLCACAFGRYNARQSKVVEQWKAGTMNHEKSRRKTRREDLFLGTWSFCVALPRSVKVYS